MNPTLYDILGVAPDAGRDEIKTAWRQAADRFEPGSGGSTAQFRLFNEAAEVLLDPDRRAAYDAELASRQADPVPVGAAPGVATLTAPLPGAATTATDLGTGVSGAADDVAESPAAPDAVTAEEAGPAEPAPAKQSGRSVPVAVLAVLGLLAAVVIGGAAYLGFEAKRAADYQEALDRAPAAAERAAVAVLSYDHESLEADRDAAAKFLTSGYRSDYLDTFELVQQNAPELKAKVEAQVLASSAMVQTGERSPNRVPVLLFVNQTTVNAARSEEPAVALNRVRFDMVKVDGTWLVDGISSY